MEIASLFAEQKWNILQQLSKQELSPLQLAKLTNTSIANISQQLKLLEAAGLVSKHKIPNRERGKPRTLYALAGEQAYVVCLTKTLAAKQLVALDSSIKISIAILFIPKPELRYPVLRYFWDIEHLLNDIQSIVVSWDNGPELTIVGDKTLEKKLSSQTIGNITVRAKLASLDKAVKICQNQSSLVLFDQTFSLKGVIAKIS